MKRGYMIGLAVLLLVPAAVYFAPGTGDEVRAQLPQMHLDLPGADGTSIPPVCTVWDEIYPAHGAPHHQDGYEDNGDNIISECDYIILDGLRWHIVWVGPTYFMSCPPIDGVFEPTIDQTGVDPSCETWHQVWPDFCQPSHVEDWIDDGDGAVSVCDVIYLPETGYWHIDQIGLDIIVEPGPVSTESSSWGQVKKIFGSVF
jgi:hypothetical protein